MFPFHKVLPKSSSQWVLPLNSHVLPRKPECTTLYYHFPVDFSVSLFLWEPPQGQEPICFFFAWCLSYSRCPIKECVTEQRGSIEAMCTKLISSRGTPNPQNHSSKKMTKNESSFQVKHLLDPWSSWFACLLTTYTSILCNFLLIFRAWAILLEAGSRKYTRFYKTSKVRYIWRFTG